MRIRIVFAKTKAMRYTSHLDLHRTWERTFRRAGLNLSFSQGYHPRAKLHLASALPLGVTSEYELLDAWLDEEICIELFVQSVERAIPPGIEIIDISEINPNEAKLPSQIKSAEYIVYGLSPQPDLTSRIKNLLQAESIIRERRGKSYDLRPLIEGLAIQNENEYSHNYRLWMRLSALGGATGRPDEVLRALNINPNNTKIHRIRIILKE